MAVGTLICPDPNGNCSQSSGADCQMDCDGGTVICQCPPEAMRSFILEGPSFQLSPAQIADLEMSCGGNMPGSSGPSYQSVDPVDMDGNPVNPSDCEETDSNGKVTRLFCYKCTNYSLWGWGSNGSISWAPVGPDGEKVFIG